MSAPDRATTSGSRTAGYVVAGLAATLPAYYLVWLVLGPGNALATCAVTWSAGVVWLLRKRSEQPGWDRELPSGR